jgi:putative tricarboxylic transport membrane protein
MNAATPENLLYAFIGCLLGTLVGVLPGLGAVSTVAILFPFTAYLPPTGMVIVMAAIYYGAMYGGSTTAILVNVPGEVPSVVTCLDGYQMTKKGRAGPALAIAAITSFEAGIIGCVFIALLGPSLAQYALSFGPTEYLGLGLFSLTAIAGLSGNSLLRGSIVAVVGMLFVIVGYDVGSNLARFTFGIQALLQGFEIVPVMIGVFGVAEMFRLLQEIETERVVSAKIDRLMPTMQELRDGIAAGTRATAFSLPLGLLPGMLPSVTAFLSYSFERQRSKTPEKFGTGMIEGVAGPEAANNAAAMGNLVPLLALGIPTGPTMALILAALTIYGMVPGPLLFTQHAQFTWTVIGSFFVANIILLILNLPLVGLWARIATIPTPILVPLVLVMCLVGSFSIRSSMFDVGVTVIFGLVGWAAAKAGWPLAPMVLAYVLGPMIEQSARQVVQISPMLLFRRPLFWLFIGGAVLVIWFSRRLWVKKPVEDQASVL